MIMRHPRGQPKFERQPRPGCRARGLHAAEPKGHASMNESRRQFLQTAAATAAYGAAPAASAQTAMAEAAAVPAPAGAGLQPLLLNVNGRPYTLKLEPRVTLLDALREYIGLTGT